MSSLDDVRVYLIHPDRELYRVHRVEHGPLYFSAAAPGRGGRFDLPAETGWGTCYLSTSPIGACIETFGRFRTVAEELVRARRLTVVAPTVQLRLADLTDRRVLGSYGIAGDLSTGPDYSPSQQWALRLWNTGFDGVYYAARHDPQFTERSVALFGRAGDGDDAEGKHLEYTTFVITDDLLRDMTDGFGIMIVRYQNLHDQP